MKRAAKGTITTEAPRPKSRWISGDTLGLIAKRGEAAAEGRYKDAESIDKQVHKKARQDRKAWFQEKLTGNVWDP
eukprot:9793532-Alexandrium_andersonii.AAC.1